MKILIVEDEKRLARALDAILKEQKYLTDVVFDGKSGYDYASAARYDVVILDVMLPEMDGFEVVRRLRADKNEVPVLLLTARTATGDKVNGLNSGADDYMTKPFEPEELLARINALTRRRGAVTMDTLSFGDLVFDRNKSELSCGENSVKLNFKEAEIIKLFLRSPSVILSKDRLISDVWGDDSEAMDNNVEAYISFLRRKLKFLGSRVIIRNHQKIGYKLEDPPCSNV